MKNKIIYFVLLLSLIFISLYPLILNTNLSITFSNYSQTLNFASRLSGIFLFTLIFIQTVLGFFLEKFVKKYGNWINKVHEIQGYLILILAIIHPVFLLLFNFKIFHTFDPFYVYTQLCLLCKSKFEFIYTLGRFAFWLLILGVFSTLLKNSALWLKRNWRKLHSLNIIVFILSALHGYFLSSDFKIFPLNYIFIGEIITVILLILFKNTKKIVDIV